MFKFQFTKNQVLFLKNYVKIADKDHGKYLSIILLKKEDGKHTACFQNTSVDVDMITTIDIPDLEADNDITTLRYSLNTFLNFVMLRGEDELITLCDNKFITNKGSYAIQNDNDAPISDIEFQDSLNFTKIKLVNIEKLRTLKNFIGSDHLKNDAVLLKNGFYIACTQGHSAIFNTKNENNSEIYLSVKMINLLDSMDMESVEVIVYEGKKQVLIKDDNSIYIFKHNRDFYVQNLLDSNTVKNWNHPEIVKFNLSDLKQVFQSMTILSSEEAFTTLIKFRFENGKIIIAMLNDMATDSINAEVPDSIVGIEIPLSLGVTHNALKSISDEEVNLHIKPISEGEYGTLKWVPSINFKAVSNPDLIIIVQCLSYGL